MGVSIHAGRAAEEWRAARRADQIAIWVREALQRPIAVRKLNIGHHLPTGQPGDTSDQRRVVIILVLDPMERHCARCLTLKTANFGNRREVDALLEEVMNEGIRRVQVEGAELQAKGLMDADGKLLIFELPPDMREGAERDFGG